MNKSNWVKLEEVYGRMEAEMIKSYLEANGIAAQIIMEAASQLWAPSITSAEILVPSWSLAEARKLMKDFGDAEIESEETED